MNGLSIARMCWLKITSGKFVFVFMFMSELEHIYFFVSLKHTVVNALQIDFV